MSELRQALEDYIAVRRSLGFDLRLPARSLRNFVSFVEANEATSITRELAVRWAKQPDSAQPATWAWRLGMVRRFASWRSVTDPRTEVPPEGLMPYRYYRKPCAWRITSHAAIKVCSCSRQYFFRVKFSLSAWLIAVAMLVLVDLLSSSGLGMRKRWQELFNALCATSKSMDP